MPTHPTAMTDAPQPVASVLLVDDDLLLCDLISRILSSQGFQVTLAHSVAEARPLLREATIAVFDVMLPDGSGIELLRLARSLGLELDVLVLTGRYSPEVAVEALRLGAVDYLQKPVDAPSILRAVRSAWEQRRAREDLARISARLAEDHRLTSLGRMAAGAAHEINNPIAAMLSNLGAAEGELAVLERFIAKVAAARGDSDVDSIGIDIDLATDVDTDLDADILRAQQAVTELRGIVSDCVVGSRRIAGVVRGMRQLAPSDTQSPSLHSEAPPSGAGVAEVMREADRIVSQCSGSVQVQWRNAVPPSVQVAGDVTDLAECLADLVAAGLRAIQHVDDGSVRCMAELEDDHVVFLVEDDGSGIGVEDLPHVFDPFFTSEVGEGPSLGMAVVRERIRRLGGTVDVSTLPGLGTEARITLQLVDQPSSRSSPTA